MLAIYGLAVLPVLLWPVLVIPLRGGWALLVGVLCYRELTRHGWARPDAFVHRFGCTREGHWFFEAGGRRHDGAVLLDRLVGPGLCVLRLSAPSLTRTLVILPDSTDEVAQRRLRAVLQGP